MPPDPITVTKLDALLAAIRGYDDPRRASAEWKQVYKLLQAAGAPLARVTGIVGMRDGAKLAELIDQLRTPETSAPLHGEVPAEEICREALRAFRKRSDLTRLDEESRISSHSPTSKGACPHAAAIIPPNEWPDSVWQELVRQGKIRCIGHGLYELIKP